MRRRTGAAMLEAGRLLAKAGAHRAGDWLPIPRVVTTREAVGGRLLNSYMHAAPADRHGCGHQPPAE